MSKRRWWEFWKSNNLDVGNQVSRQDADSSASGQVVRGGNNCSFCGKALNDGKGIRSISSSNVDDAFSAMQAAAEQMLMRKCVCVACKAVFCLECGNEKGMSLDSGGTHCPKCGTKVPNEQL